MLRESSYVYGAQADCTLVTCRVKLAVATWASKRLCRGSGSPGWGRKLGPHCTTSQSNEYTPSRVCMRSSQSVFCFSVGTLFDRLISSSAAHSNRSPHLSLSLSYSHRHFFFACDHAHTHTHTHTNTHKHMGAHSHKREKGPNPTREKKHIGSSCRLLSLLCFVVWFLHLRDCEFLLLLGLKRALSTARGVTRVAVCVLPLALLSPVRAGKAGRDGACFGHGLRDVRCDSHCPLPWTR